MLVTVPDGPAKPWPLRTSRRFSDRFCRFDASRIQYAPAIMELYVGVVGIIAGVFVVIFDGRGLIPQHGRLQ